MPDAPGGDYVTRDLPLVVPSDAPEGGATGMPTSPPAAQPAPGDAGALPTVDTASSAPGARQDAAAPAAELPMLPASVAGGAYAVHFGAYPSSVSADTVVSRLRAAQLPAYRESADVNGKTAWRVRIGPYATRADAETSRLRANTVGQSSTSRVVALDADAATPAAASTPVAATPAAAPATPQPLPAEPPASKPLASTPKPATPATPAPVTPAKPAVAPPAKPAASGTGFAVQLGAFGSVDQANRKRDELRAANISAFTETVKTDKGTLTRVLAGPVLSRSDADALKAQVKAKLGVDGMVRSHP